VHDDYSWLPVAEAGSLLPYVYNDVIRQGTVLIFWPSVTFRANATFNRIAQAELDTA